jgi:hypothetical protein
MQESLKTQRTERRAAEVAEKNDKILNREGRKGRKEKLGHWSVVGISHREIVQNARQS